MTTPTNPAPDPDLVDALRESLRESLRLSTPAAPQPETEGERCCIKNGNAATPKGGEFLWCDRHSEGAFETEGMMFGEWLDRQFRINPAKFGSLTYDELRAAWTAAKKGGRS